LKTGIEPRVDTLNRASVQLALLNDVMDGERTVKLTMAHLNFFRGIHNPIGVKVRTSMGEDD